MMSPQKALPLLLCLLSVTNAIFDHNSQHCHDVSVWGDVMYKDKACSKCTTDFVKDCTNVTEIVCDDVPSLHCELVPYTKCHMYMEQVEYNETEVINDVYNPHVCINKTREEIHTKMVPKCVLVERQNCVTKWIYSNGAKIWDGNEHCTPVQWNNCTLHPEDTVFNQTYTDCMSSGPPIPTMKCKLEVKTRMITGMRCDVKHAVHCTTSTTRECKDITFTECRQNPRPTHCNDTVISVPYQPQIHRVKCLLVNENESPDLDVEDSEEAAMNKLDAFNKTQSFDNNSKSRVFDLRSIQ